MRFKNRRVLLGNHRVFVTTTSSAADEFNWVRFSKEGGGNSCRRFLAAWHDVTVRCKHPLWMTGHQSEWVAKTKTLSILASCAKVVRLGASLLANLEIECCFEIGTCRHPLKHHGPLASDTRSKMFALVQWNRFFKNIKTIS